MEGLAIKFKGFTLREKNVTAYLSMDRPSRRASLAYEGLHR